MATLEALNGLQPSERAELEWLLASGALGRSANLTRVLRYICEETAAGRADHIKEYAIAVDALGRKPDFDAQTDTIVRVTVHSLRKRLQDIYESGEGASHAIRLVIPAGGYAAHFLHLAERPEVAAATAAPVQPEPTPADVSPAPSPAPEIAEPTAIATAPPIKPAAPAASPATHRDPWLWLAALAALLLITAGAIWRLSRTAPNHATQQPSGAAAVQIAGPAHILFGEGRHAYTDHSGMVWTPQRACDGGESVPSAGLTIAGTEDSYIYDGGLRGIVRCTFHARAGMYELRLHLAEPGNLEPAQRVVTFSINAGPAQTIDVVDRAGGDHTATIFTIPGVSPENDGTIHLDFTSEVSPVNAIEILPAPSAQPLPYRIVAASKPFTDDQGNVWLSDRYFRGGRHGQPPDQEHRPSLGLYASGRVGTFQYTLPAPVGSKYRVTLYFREPWFGQAAGAPGGPGSRVFNVLCNGEVLLRNFDILAEGQGNSVSKTIDGVTPTAHGQLNIEFVPVVNYPLVNAIAVTPEQP